MNIIRRCELLASLLDHVAKALWDFGGMNVKGDFAVVGVKDIRECGLRSAKLPCDLPNMFFTGASQRKLPVDACCKPQLPHSNHSNKQERWKKYRTWHIPNSNVMPRNSLTSSKLCQKRDIKPHHFQFAKFQSLSKNENPPALRVASFFAGPCCQRAVGLQWHECQRRLRSGRCERHPRVWAKIRKTTTRLANLALHWCLKHVLHWCLKKKAAIAACRCLLQALVAHSNHSNKQERWKYPTWHIPNSNVPPRNL